MRPINKGDWPKENGQPIDFPKYGDARPYLIERLGDYCSYCENQITNPQVEHIQPKKIMPEKERDWDNFLLCCGNCNSIKNDTLIELDDYYWPDVHNTCLLFQYHALGVVTIKTPLHPSIDIKKSQRTLLLTGLERYGHGVASSADRRWIKRSEAYGKAEDALNYYVGSGRSVEYVRSITNMATSTGFWSVWMKVFENEPQVVIALKNSFPNTFDNCHTTNIDRQ